MAKVATKSIAGAPQQEDIEAATKVYEPLFKIESGRTQELGKAKQEAERAALGVEQAKTQAEGERLRAVADFQKGAAEQERMTYERAEREIAENPLPDFKPSQPELRNYAQLGGLIATMGLMLGGAKGNALASINAFSGALQGWKAGRKDIYDKEIKKFNLEFNKVKATRDQIMKNLDLGLKKLAAGNKAGLADLEAAKFISGSNSILAKQIDAGNYKAAYETMAATYKLESDTNNKILEMAKAIRQSIETKALNERQANALVAAAKERAKGMVQAAQEREDAITRRKMLEAGREKPGVTKTQIKTASDGSLILVDMNTGISSPIKDRQGNIVKAPSKKESQSALLSGRAENIREAFLQAAKDMENISKLPRGTMLSSFSEMAGSGGQNLISALRNQILRSEVTEKEQRFMQQLMAGIEGHLAFALGGGYASSNSAARMKQYKEQLAREGDDPAVATMMLARLRQEMNVLAENFPQKPGVTPEMVESIVRSNERINKAIPFTVEDVIEAEFGSSSSKVGLPNVKSRQDVMSEADRILSGK